MKKQRSEDLINTYVSKKATVAEQELLEHFFLEDLKASTSFPDEQRIIQADEKIRKNLMKHIASHKSPRKLRLWPGISAAAVLLMISIASFWFFKQKGIQQTTQQGYARILPGSNKATLTLADGKTIALTDTKDEQLISQGDANITKGRNGELYYKKTADNSSAAQPYNTLSTPRGGMYRLMLSDGTLVILNAASSITYPTVFSGKERNVSIQGEVYFEVKHNTAMPFRVKSDQQTIEVLGTHFNVNTYSNPQQTKTTLLQGSVRVTSSGNSKLLKPGEQSVLNRQEIKIIKVDPEDAIAWKNGLFVFDDEPLEEIMESISRWYDVDIVYDGVDKSLPFGGGVSRFEQVSKVLEKLELTGKVHFKIQGRRILVTK